MSFNRKLTTVLREAVDLNDWCYRKVHALIADQLTDTVRFGRASGGQFGVLFGVTPVSFYDVTYLTYQSGKIFVSWTGGIATDTGPFDNWSDLRMALLQKIEIIKRATERQIYAQYDRIKQYLDSRWNADPGPYDIWANDEHEYTDRLAGQEIPVVVHRYVINAEGFAISITLSRTGRGIGPAVEITSTAGNDTDDEFWPMRATLTPAEFEEFLKMLESPTIPTDSQLLTWESGPKRTRLLIWTALRRVVGGHDAPDPELTPDEQRAADIQAKLDRAIGTRLQKSPCRNSWQGIMQTDYGNAMITVNVVEATGQSAEARIHWYLRGVKIPGFSHDLTIKLDRLGVGTIKDYIENAIDEHYAPKKKW